MRLRIDSGAITADVPYATHRELTHPDRAAAVLIARGHSAALAPAIAGGALSTRQGAIGLARRAGLVEAVETSEARGAGLLK